MKHSVVVVGAGITGLYLAKLLGDKGLKPLVIARDRGGLLKQYKDGKFIFDYGGHVYTKTDERLNEIMMRTTAESHVRNAIYLSEEHGRIPYPVQDHAEKMGVKTYSVGHDPARWKSLQDVGLDMYGPEFYEEFFAPFNRRVWTADPVELDVDWIRSRIRLPSEKKEKWGPNAEFWYAPGDEIADVLTSMATKAGAEFRIGGGSEVVYADLARKRLHLQAGRGEGRRIDYDLLFWTAPISQLAAQVGISPSVFRSNYIMTLGLGLRYRLDEEPFHWAYFDVIHRAHRMTWLSRYHESLAPEGHDSLLIEYPFSYPDYALPHFVSNALIEAQDYVDAHEIHRGLAQRMCENIGLPFTQKDMQAVALGTAPGYPLPTRGIRDIVAITKSRLMVYDVYTAGRWGSWGYFNINHCFDDAEAAVGIKRGDWESESNYLQSKFYYGRK